MTHDWMATDAKHVDLTEADIADLSRRRFVRPDADPFSFDDDLDGGAKVIAWMFVAIALFAVFNIAAAVLCKMGWVG